jgi:hypothetical protein
VRALLALFAAAAVLVIVELSLGAVHAGEAHLADPCQPRAFSGSAIQRIVLNGLDGAACRLHISREELVLSVGSSAPFHTHWSKQQITVALRAGLLRAVDDAERRGEIPGFLVGPIRTFIRTAPIDKLVSGGISLRDLLAP